jgi:hypothetical protein
VTFVRPRVARVGLGAFVERLNEAEPEGRGRWQTDSSEMTSAVKFLDASGAHAASRLEPDAVAKELRAILPQQKAEA